MSDRLRVLIVDDSAFARKVLGQALRADPRLEVLEPARDGLEALEKIQALRPDVVTLDLVMPGLDGLGLLRALGPERAARVVVVTVTDADSALGVAALEAGAFDLVHKPTALATDRLYELAGELVAKVAAAGALTRQPRPAPARAAPLPQLSGAELIAIGTSTGGPQALTRLLPALPASFPVPIVIALHIPEGYTRSMAARLDELCALEVVEGSGENELRPGRAVLARGGLHLDVLRRPGGLVGRTAPAAGYAGYVPSVDRLLESAAAAVASRLVAVVLTGMGSDGLAGARAVRAAGGRVLTEAEETCVVYGMPRAIVDEGLSDGEVPLDRMAGALLAVR